MSLHLSSKWPSYMTRLISLQCHLLSRWFAFAETHFSFGFLVIGVAPSSLSTLPISLQCHSLFKWSDTWIWHLEGHWRWSDTWKDTWRPPGFFALSFSFQRQPLCHWDMIHCTVQSAQCTVHTVHTAQCTVHSATATPSKMHLCKTTAWVFPLSYPPVVAPPAQCFKPKTYVAFGGIIVCGFG